MRGRIARAWAEHRLVFLAFLLAVAATLFFAVKLVVVAVVWSDPARRDQPVAGWMTPGYVARSWRVSLDDILAALALQRGPGTRPTTLAEIAERSGRPLAEVIATVEAVIAAARTDGRPPP
ncbi:MAG: hypothetical protein KJZ85_20150 [Rhodobacteraceae bacterium]|jgi:hypothetical protein|nr:hypothetical protein [Paracoccaceae bacterium]